MKKKITYISFLILMFPFAGFAQTGESSFGFLKLPSSSHVSALGGTNISLVGQDVSLAWQNPALLGAEMDNQLSLNYMNYISDINIGGFLYARELNENGAWAAGVQYMDYGSFDETTADNQIIGTFGAKDILMSGMLGYNISTSWRGGASAKFIYSSYESYTSVALAVDLGLNYYNENSDFSASLAVKNLGGQIKKFEDVSESLPFDLQLGLSQSLAHAPFRYSLTFINLTDWDSEYVDNSTSDEDETTTEKDNFAKKILRHTVLGLDYLPNENFYLSLGYRYKARQEFADGGGGFFTGFSAGAGVHIRMFDINASIARYHRSGTSFMIGVNLLLNDR